MLNKKLRSELLGGAFTDGGTFMKGCYRGYYMVLDTIRQQNGTVGGQRLTIGAFREDDPENTSLKAFLGELRQRHSEIKALAAENAHISISFLAYSNKKLVEQLNGCVDELVDYMIREGYRSGCFDCGRETADCYDINGYHFWLCPDCFGTVQQEITDRADQIRLQKSNLLKGAVGALLGTLVGVGLYVGIYQLGYISALVGLVMAILTFWLYEKMGGALDVKGVLVCVVMMVFGVIMANRLVWTLEFYNYFKTEYQVTFGMIYQDLKELITENELTADYYRELVSAFLFTALGSVGSIISAVKKSKGTDMHARKA